jgi:hypothetical protein
MKTVAIVGRSKETRDLAPFDNPRVDIWAFNDYAMQLPRVTGVFETHPDCLTADRYDDAYKEWLRLPHEFPIWMHESDPAIPASLTYPRNAICALYATSLWRGGERVQHFFSSTTAYALAMALWKRYNRVELYGIELYDNGYRKQADCVFFWLGQAAARGVEIIIHENSNLFRNTLYPFDVVTPEPVTVKAEVKKKRGSK